MLSPVLSMATIKGKSFSTSRFTDSHPKSSKAINARGRQRASPANGAQVHCPIALHGLDDLWATLALADHTL